MSLNDMRLHSSLLARLYPGTLVETATETNVARSVPEAQPVRFLGKNARQVILMVRNADLPFLSDGELAFLTNVLAACKLSLADVAVVNAHNLTAPQMQAAMDQLNAQMVVLFGIEPTELDLPLHFPPFQVQSFSGRRYVHAPALGHVEGDKTLKMQLWNALKTLFGL